MAQLCEQIVHNFKINTMTSLTWNAQNSYADRMMLLPSFPSFGSNASSNKKSVSVSSTSKNWFRKLSAKRVSFDWDLNRNELEFE